MKKTIFSISFLTIVWIILCENFSLKTAAVGFTVSVCVQILIFLLFPRPERHYLSYTRFIFYIFYLITQIYISGFSTIKRILFADIEVGIVEIETEIEDNLLKAALVNSITLTPGTISLGLDNNKLTVLCLKRPPNSEADEIIKGNLERMLLKAQLKKKSKE